MWSAVAHAWACAAVWMAGWLQGPLPKPRLKMASRDVSQEFEGGGDPDVRELTCDVVIVGSGAGEQGRREEG